MPAPPTKKLPLRSMIDDGYELLDLFCTGNQCGHSATVRIAMLIAAGVDPDASMSDLPMRCTVCGHRGVDARTNMEEHYDRCARTAKQGKYAEGSSPVVLSPPRDLYAGRDDIAGALTTGRYP